MAPSLEELEVFPRPAGQNPFRIKGTAYLGHLDFVARSVPGGNDAVCAQFRSEPLREFFRQPFLATGWYDIYPMVPVTEATARLVGMPFERFLRHRTRLQTEGDVRGVYKVLLRLASAEMLATRMPRIVSQYLDFGEGRGRMVGPREAELVQVGVPDQILAFHVPVVETFCEVLLREAGVRSVRARCAPPERSGLVHGVPTCTLNMNVVWSS